MTDQEQNKKTIVSYYETAFGGEPEKAVAQYMGASYRQHNPEADDGPEAFIQFVHALRKANPDLKLLIKKVIAEGDTVVTHAHLVLKPDDRGVALADFFRLEDGKVVEHWDVIQAVPERSANPNGMF